MKSLNGMFLGILAVSVFVACNAAQPKQQNQVSLKQAATTTGKTDSIQAPASSSKATNTKITVYYFHGNARCPTCYLLENYAKSEVETDFADPIKNGKLEWKTINVDEKGNEHFTDNYKLYTKSVIVSTVKDGKEASWKNLDQIWQLVHDQGVYREYIKKEVKACLDGNCL
jgi:hypothetical protein